MEKLSTDQQNALSILRQGRNILLTGGAGTGKTYLLDKYLRESKAIRVAPTGKAAIKVGGVTIHRFFRAPIGIIEPKKIEAIPANPDSAASKLQRIIGEDNAKIIKSAEVVAIDEISMCRSDLFTYVFNLIKMAERAFDKQIQLVLCGDFYQLPPITPHPPHGNAGAKTIQEWEAWKLFNADNLEGWPFLSQAWQEADIKVVELKTIIRQKEPAFAEALNKIRIGDESGLEWIKENCAKGTPDKDFLSIVARNDKAASENLYRLSQIPEKEAVYPIDFPVLLQNGRMNEATQKDYMSVCEEKLVLRVGARVIVLINDTKEGNYVNGSIGTVIKTNPASVKVKFDNGFICDIEPHKWVLNGYEIKKKGKETIIEQREIGEFSQIPLRLAWASTVHKSQGETIDGCIQVVCTPQFFAPGMAYVALSRATTINNLYITGKPKLMVAEAVKQFFETIQKGKPSGVETFKEDLAGNEPIQVKKEKFSQTELTKEVNTEQPKEEKPREKKVQQKRGRGRPGAFKGEIVPITIKLPQKDIKRLKMAAIEHGMTVAQLIHDFIETGI